ncbi:MAG: glycosyltransferase [Patescibacteria group bacterium]
MISFIIPTFNEETTIRQTIEGLKRLSLPHEIIVSDDNSADNTVPIVRSLTDKIVIYPGPGRQTTAAGRNDGTKLASGEFIVFFDAGSVIKNPDVFFAQALENFNNPNIVGITGCLKVFPEKATFFDKLVFGVLNLNYRIMNNVFKKGVAAGKFQMVRKSAFNMVGGFNIKLPAAEDSEFFRRLSKVGRTYFDPRLIVFHGARRARQIGWPRLLWSWFINSIWVAFFGKSFSKEWTVIR